MGEVVLGQPRHHPLLLHVRPARHIDDEVAQVLPVPGRGEGRPGCPTVAPASLLDHPVSLPSHFLLGPVESVSVIGLRRNSSNCEDSQPARPVPKGAFRGRCNWFCCEPHCSREELRRPHQDVMLLVSGSADSVSPCQVSQSPPQLGLQELPAPEPAHRALRGHSPHHVHGPGPHFGVAAHDGHAGSKGAIDTEDYELRALGQHGDVAVRKRVVSPGRGGTSEPARPSSCPGGGRPGLLAPQRLSPDHHLDGVDAHTQAVGLGDGVGDPPAAAGHQRVQVQPFA